MSIGLTFSVHLSLCLSLCLTRSLFHHHPPPPTPTSYAVPEAGSRGTVVVFYLQGHRVPGHSVFHSEEEVQPGQLPPRLPPLHHVHPLVDRDQVGRRGTV